MPTTNTCIYHTAKNTTEEPSGFACKIWKGSIFRHIRAQQAQSRRGEKPPSPKEMHGATDCHWNKHTGHTGPQPPSQGQARPCAWTFAAIHKTCSWFTAREFRLPQWRDWAMAHHQTPPRDSPSSAWHPTLSTALVQRQKCQRASTRFYVPSPVSPVPLCSKIGLNAQSFYQY